MADRLRIVSLQWPKPPAVIVDLAASPQGQRLSRDTFKVTAGDPGQVLSASTTRWGGSSVVGEHRANATLSVTLLMMGDTTLAAGAQKDSALARIGAVLETALSANQPDLAIEWRPDGASRSSFWRLRGPATYGLSYRWVEFQSATLFPIDVSFTVAPTGDLAEMDIFDDFSTDTITNGDWVKDAGTASMQVILGQMRPSASGGTAMRYRHTRGYAYGDIEVSWRMYADLGTGTYRLCLGMDPAGSETYLALEMTSTGSQLVKLVNGTRTVLSTAGTLAASATQPTYMLLRRAGNVIYWRIANALTWAEYSVEPNTYVLTAADLRLAAPGHIGFSVVASSTAEWYEDVSARPFTYRGHQSPETVQLVGAIPGDIPARANIEITPVVGSSTNPAIFGLVAWGERPKVQNLLTVGNLTTIRSNASATYGWTNSAVAGVIGAATSYARGVGTVILLYGGSSLQIQCPATTDTGASFLVTRRFKRGRVYAAFARIGGNNGALARVKLGVSGDLSTGTSRSLNLTQDMYSTVWRPTADYDSAYMAIGNAAATAVLIEGSGIGVVECPPVTLAANVLTAATTISVYYNPTDLPGLNPDGSVSSPFLVMVDQELMSVRSIVGTVWTVDRGVELTTATTHSTDAYVIVMPPARPQLEGKGAHPIFGVIEGENFCFDRQAITPTVGQSNYRGGGYAGLSASGSIEYYVDPSSVPPDDFGDGDVLVELWARLALDPAGTGLVLVTSCGPSEQYDPTVALASLAGVRRYTLEHGSDGMSQANGKLSVPSGSGGTLYPQWFCLGTLPMVSDQKRPQRWRIRLDWTQSAGAGIRVDYLIPVPARNRAASPAGSYNAATYLGFLPPNITALAVTKVLLADGSGLLRMPRLGAYTQPDGFPDAGMGPEIDMPNTDCDLLVKTSDLVPNDPGPNGQEMPSGAPSWLHGYHVAVTPRVAAGGGA